MPPKPEKIDDLKDLLEDVDDEVTPETLQEMAEYYLEDR